MRDEGTYIFEGVVASSNSVELFSRARGNSGSTIPLSFSLLLAGLSSTLHCTARHCVRSSRSQTPRCSLRRVISTRVKTSNKFRYRSSFYRLPFFHLSRLFFFHLLIFLRSLFLSLLLQIPSQHSSAHATTMAALLFILTIVKGFTQPLEAQ